MWNVFQQPKFDSLCRMDFDSTTVLSPVLPSIIIALFFAISVTVFCVHLHIYHLYQTMCAKILGVETAKKEWGMWDFSKQWIFDTLLRVNFWYNRRSVYSKVNFASSATVVLCMYLYTYTSACYPTQYVKPLDTIEVGILVLTFCETFLDNTN